MQNNTTKRGHTKEGEAMAFKPLRMLLAGLLLATACGSNPAFATVLAPKIDLERLLDAVWVAEGKEAAHPAYGVVSWPKCGEVGACRYFAGEIIRVHHARWVKAGSNGDFIDYLGSKYAPVSAHKLNENWIRNVKFHYEKDL